ncbi:hypothetical protein B0J13DRAFT_323415 [Dactylonectria estremocensis]|uniref:F-box domain-containing protein n=1 Tax=Dactylonectria estremocensis TaxID=1079267 RepID=A0A9P9ERC4_9HYPO|nr:hypothetical protein B0J13DRAFT_323415 [Dactylonectria estremocensis]
MAQHDGGGNRAPLTRLSTELILHIINYLDFISHADFAFTCKWIANCSHDLLLRHQDAHRKYKNLSDLSPETVPTLLKSAIELRDPIPVWHVRSFDIWGARQAWVHWRPFNLRGSVDRTVVPLPWDYDEDAIDAYIGRLRYRMTDDQLERARYEFKHGHDAFMKMRLISLCPRLRDLKFVNYGTRAKKSIQWLSAAIEWHRTGEAWPSGLLALRFVAVGVPWPDTPSYAPATELYSTYHHYPAYTLTSLLKLPNIDSLYFSGCREPEVSGYDDPELLDLDYNEDVPVKELAATYNLRPGCSSVKHLFLANFDGVRTNFGQMVFEAARELVSMSFRHENQYGDFDEVPVHSLGESLESLMFYNGRDWSEVHTESYAPESIRSAPRHLSMNVNEVAYSANRGCNYEELRSTLFVQYFATKAFSTRLEVLILWGSLGEQELESGDASDFLDDAVAALITSGHCPNLKIVHLEDLEHDVCNHNMAIADKIWFQKAMAAGERAGVDVYTVTNRNLKKHGLQLPKAPDQFDIATAPCSELRPDNFWFSPSTGQWEQTGCRSCGRCSDCLRVYTEELWQTIRPALRDDQDGGTEPLDES